MARKPWIFQVFVLALVWTLVAGAASAQDAKTGCPISRLFAGNTEITLDAKLV